MNARVRSLPLVFVIACLALLRSVHGAVLEGQTIAVVNFHGSAPDSTQVIGPVEAVVGTGTEFLSFGWASFVDIDVSDTSVVISLNIDQPFGYSEVLRLTDPDGRLPDFTGATVNPATTFAGFTQSRVFVSPNVIDIHLTGLDGLENQQIVLDITAVPVPPLPKVPLPPVGLHVSSIVGDMVTLRWSLLAGGLAPTNFVLEGGLSPGETVASVPTGSASPIFTFAAPTGSFYVRVRAESGSVQSEPSNEIQIHINVPVPPSAPAGLLALVNGSSAALAWKNTFGGGAPSSVILDVTGAVTMSVPLGLVESLAVDAIPAGTYHLSLRAANAAGSSGSSNQVTMTFPGPCSGAPLPPANFLAYTIGSTVVAVWDPAATGPAPTGYVLNVSGALSGVFSTTIRMARGVVPPGSYALSVHATNSCGASEPTAAQTVTIP